MLETSTVYKTLGFFSENIWSLFSRKTHQWVSRSYSHIYKHKISRHFIKPYCSWQYGDKKHYLKYKPGSGSENYKNFQDFFTRDFKEQLNPNYEFVWPAEGLLCDVKRISSGAWVKVKQDRLPIRQVFASSAESIPEDYFFSNVFLHNKNYHHIHAPVESEIVRIEHIPGSLLWLRPQAYPKKPSLPALINERINLELKDSYSRIWYLSIVGGPGVATIKLQTSCAIGAKLKVGEKIAGFELGSTCCMASPLSPIAQVGDLVWVGELFSEKVTV